MTSARVFYSLLAAIVVTGVPASFDPAWERVYVIAWIMAAALAALVAVAKLVAGEIRWRREIDRIIAEPTDLDNPSAGLRAIPPAMPMAADPIVAR